MERIVQCFISTPELINTLRECRQFAFIKGGSTEAALHNIVVRAERALQTENDAVLTILDIEGAFSHASFASMHNAVVSLNVSDICRRWIDVMLRSR